MYKQILDTTYRSTWIDCRCLANQVLFFLGCEQADSRPLCAGGQWNSADLLCITQPGCFRTLHNRLPPLASLQTWGRSISRLDSQLESFLESAYFDGLPAWQGKYMVGQPWSKARRSSNFCHLSLVLQAVIYSVRFSVAWL